MLRLLEFLYQKRLFGLFLLLEGISFWLLFSYNHRYNSYFVNSSNLVIGEISYQIGSVNRYFSLKDENNDLARENLWLRNKLARRNFSRDTTLVIGDSAMYAYSLTEIINSTHLKSRNFLTLRINAVDSIKPGMGVVSGFGVIGKVKSVSSRFATVTSALNPNLLISCRVKTNDALCTAQWDGVNPRFGTLKFVPRHMELKVGDSIVTSGFDTVFPKDYLVGVVSEKSLRTESPFYDAKIEYSTDFTSVRTAYVVKTLFAEEKMEMEEEVDND